MKNDILFIAAWALGATAAVAQTDSVATIDKSATAVTEIVVRTKARQVSESAAVQAQKQAEVEQTTTSAEQIARTQDKDAGEVIRRVPGISIIEEKFVMVRGLSQRYNNVWLNRQAVPSSEADARAFSFDLIPAGQLDNLTIVKSAAAEYPADFSGGFILINTKDVPSQSTLSLNAGTGINPQAHFRGFNTIDGHGWNPKSKTPWGDLSLGASGALRHDFADGTVLSGLMSANYSETWRTCRDMDNNLFGAYDHDNNRSVYLRHSTDQQYNFNTRLGAMLNLAVSSASRLHRIEWKNIFNRLTRDRYTSRLGLDAQSDLERGAELYRQSRITVGTQLAGRHQLSNADELTWGAGYAFANRDMPDRRRFNTVWDDGMGRFVTENLNEVNREWSYLKEHILSGSANWKHNIGKMYFRTGGYTEWRSRKYNTDQYIYCRDGGLNANLQRLDPQTGLLADETEVYLLPQTDWRNNYEGRWLVGAGYAAAAIPVGKLGIYAGVRFEHSRMELVSHTKKLEPSPASVYYTYNDFFPSINLKYTINDQQQLRASYGRTTNRAEFREVSSSVYYDFDLASNVQGNYALRPAYIDNIDLGWEWYPRRGELISLSLFYKHFKDPIEWTYTVAGGTDLIYSYVNAEGANNYGIELDVRKTLDFIGLDRWSVNINGSWIHSRVAFPDGAREKNRPMQGQSPYLVNGGLFYADKARGWNLALLYNRIGKRIIGVGRSMGGTANEVRVPDSYEMPRNSIDITAAKRLGHWQIKAAVRDILGEKVQFKQFEGDVEQTVRSYRPGTTFNIAATYSL